MTGRNEKCPCGSGKKYKNCCIGGFTATPPPRSEEVEKIATLVGVVNIDGKQYEIYEPKMIYLDCMDFDRPMCALGVKEYIRPMMATEGPLEDTPEATKVREVIERSGATHCLIREIKPGIRFKDGIKLEKQDHDHT